MVQTASPALDAILDEEIDWRFKGFPPVPERVTIGTVGAQGWNVLRGDLPLPALLLKARALEHNIDLMARYAREHGVSLAPHGKTPLAPQLAWRQIEAGAWGITAANLHQARVFRAFGIERILIANEVVDETTLRWIAREMTRHDQVEILFLVDSRQGAALAIDAAERIAPTRPLPVLLEWGSPGARAGIRTLNEARTVAHALRGTDHLQLRGVEGYEGAVRSPSSHERVAAVDRYLGDLRAVAIDLAQTGAFDGGEEIIVTAGGSMFMDRVVEILGNAWDLPLPVRVLLRSGSYIGHDSDEYARFSGLGARGAGSERLEPALELWGRVLSTPEPGVAIVGFGKRDASYDVHLPMPFAAVRDGEIQDIAGRATIAGLNDQHAYMTLADGCHVAVGDLIGCHISHACTSFDKWHLVPVVSEDYTVTGAIRTFF